MCVSPKLSHILAKRGKKSWAFCVCQSDSAIQQVVQSFLDCYCTVKVILFQLECGKIAGRSDRDLIPAYVSLAQTHLDNKNYASAIQFYKIELKEREHEPAQVSDIRELASLLLTLCGLIPAGKRIEGVGRGGGETRF